MRMVRKSLRAWGILNLAELVGKRVASVAHFRSSARKQQGLFGNKTLNFTAHSQVGLLEVRKYGGLPQKRDDVLTLSRRLLNKSIKLFSPFFIKVVRQY